MYLPPAIKPSASLRRQYIMEGVSRRTSIPPGQLSFIPSVFCAFAMRMGLPECPISHTRPSSDAWTGAVQRPFTPNALSGSARNTGFSPANSRQPKSPGLIQSRPFGTGDHVTTRSGFPAASRRILPIQRINCAGILSPFRGAEMPRLFHGIAISASHV